MQVADAWLVHLAAFKALTAEKRGLLRTRSLHGELVNNLSGTKHVSAIRRPLQQLCNKCLY